MKFLLLFLILSLSVFSVSSFGDFKPNLSDGDGDGGMDTTPTSTMPPLPPTDGDGGMDTTPTSTMPPLTPTEGGVCDVNDCYSCDNDGANTGCTAVGCLWDATDTYYGPCYPNPNYTPHPDGRVSGGPCTDDDDDNIFRCEDGSLVYNP